MSAPEAYTQEMRKLILKREIQKISGELVEKAEKLLGSKESLNKDFIKENQIRNVINVTIGCESISVVTNFIKYQIGRSNKDQGWKYNNFGETLITELKGLEGYAEKVVRQADQETPGFQAANTTEEVREVYIELARLYLGYLNRYFKYWQEKGGGNG